MLEGLAAINWDKLSHAYGSAEDVPQLIRRLTTSLPSDDSSPLWELFGNIWHQGTVYEASPFAVPFLIEVARCETTPDRAGVLSLVAALAAGTPYTKKSDCRKAIVSCWEQLNSIFNDTKGEVRLSAAHVMAQFPETGSQTGALIQSAYSDEPQTLYKSGYVILLGQVQDSSPAAKQLILEAMRSGTQSLRVAGMIAVSSLNIREVEVSELGPLLDYEQIEAAASQYLAGLPWDFLAEIDENRTREYGESFR